MASVVIEERISIPLGLSCLEEFRDWARSDDFPLEGRIDYIGGNLEVDMSPEDLFTHGTLKTTLTAALFQRVQQLDLGHLFSDCTRVSHAGANVSVEPDIVLIKHESIETGRVTLIPKAAGPPDRFVEIEGGPDLIVEIVSDGSVKKDTERLRDAYAAARVLEYWLVDARGEELSFQIYVLAGNTYRPAAKDDAGFLDSPVLDSSYRLDRWRGKGGYWQYALQGRSN